LFFSLFMFVTALLIAGGLVVLTSGRGSVATPPLSAVASGAMRYFTTNFQIGAKASEYSAHCVATSTVQGIVSYTCQVVRGTHPPINITTVFVTETQIGSGQNFAATFSFVPN
jgi:hypothetical protein